jgi:hypothetical protein
MTTELVLLLGIYAFIVLGVFLGDFGPIQTFKRSAPRLAARVERNLTTGHGFAEPSKDGKAVNWVAPLQQDGGQP